MKTFEKIKNTINIFAGIAALYFSICVALYFGFWLFVLPIINLVFFAYFAGLVIFHFLRGIPRLKSYHVFFLIMSVILDSLLFIPAFFNSIESLMAELFEFLEDLPPTVSGKVFIASGFSLFAFFSILSIIAEIVYTVLKNKQIKVELDNSFGVFVKAFTLFAALVCAAAAIIHINVFNQIYVLLIFIPLIVILFLMGFTKVKETRTQFALGLLFVLAGFYTWFYIALTTVSYTDFGKELIQKFWYVTWIATTLVIPAVLILNVVYSVKLNSKKNNATQVTTKTN